MRRIKEGMLVCALGFLLCGCSVATEEEIQQYVEDKYGKAELIGADVVSEDEAIYYFCDEEHGFEYHVKSSVDALMIDGAIFGETESKRSDFEEVYYSYVLSQVQDELEDLEHTQGILIVTFDPETEYEYTYQFATIYYVEDEQTASQIAKAVNDLFAAYDSRNHWEHMYVQVFTDQGEKLGAYNYKYDCWLTPEEEGDVAYWDRIEALNPDAEYVRKEQVPFRETGADLSKVSDSYQDQPLTEDSMVTCYYFTVKGKEYFLADFLVEEEYSAKWYTNYKKK